MRNRKRSARAVALGVVGLGFVACSSSVEPTDDTLGGGGGQYQSDAGARDAARASDGAVASSSSSSSGGGGGGSSGSSGALHDSGGGGGDVCSPNPCPQDRAEKKCVPASGALGYACVMPCDGVSCASPLACNPATGQCGNACDEANCAPTEVCIASIHGQWSGACVDGHQCDCSNCGNCGAGGSFVGMQAFCGNPSGAPATMACTKSCGGGEGCIPFGQDTAGNAASICYPLEGCFDTQ